MHSKMYFCFFAQKHTFQMPRRLRQWDVDDIDDILMLFSHCADGIDISAHHRWDVDGCHGPRKLKLFGCVCACGSKLEVFSRTCILCVYIFVHINTMFLPVSVIILTVSSELLMSSILRHSLSVRYRSLFFFKHYDTMSWNDYGHIMTLDLCPFNSSMFSAHFNPNVQLRFKQQIPHHRNLNLNC